MEYTHIRAASTTATTLAMCVALLLLVVNGVAGSILYASGSPYSYQYPYPYALAYSYTQPSLVLANHLLPLDVSHDTSSPLATAIQSSETPSKDATAEDDDVENDDDDDTRKSVDYDEGTKSEETPCNQSSAQPPILLGEEVSVPVTSLFLEQTETSSTALGDQPPTFAIPTPTPTEESESGKLKYYYPSLLVTYTTPKPMVWPMRSQFHIQDGLGHYMYGYANEHSSKQEFKLLDGLTRGAYNYIDAEGKLQTVSYVSSDGEGFRVAATNLPQPVVPVNIEDSPEVAAAKAAHLQALSQAVANVNGANNASDADAGPSANPSGDNVVSGCNETSEVKR